MKKTNLNQYVAQEHENIYLIKKTLKEKNDELKNIIDAKKYLDKKGIGSFITSENHKNIIITTVNSAYSLAENYALKNIYEEKDHPNFDYMFENKLVFDFYLNAKDRSVFIRSEDDSQFTNANFIYSKYHKSKERENHMHISTYVEEGIVHGPSIPEIMHQYSKLKVPQTILSKLEEDIKKLRYENPIKQNTRRV